MRFPGRQPLRTLLIAFGSSLIWSRNQVGIGAQTATQPKFAPLRTGPLFVMGLLEERKWKK
jgi:hypothetical protein